jgi:hypothetical protein
MASATNGYKREHGLSPAQHRALDLLVAGETDGSVAEAVGVHRVTVWKWRHYDPEFQAQLNQRRREIWSASKDRLRSLLPIALDTLEAELHGGRQRARTALEILRLAGLEASAFKGRSLGADGIGETDSEAIVDRFALARRIDPFDVVPAGGPVTDLERQSVLDELNAELTRS